jgi:hypothetical protein
MSGTSAVAAELLPFVQLEYAGRLGLVDGRYLAHEPGEGGGENQVLIVETLGGPRPARRRRPRRVDPETAPAELPLTRVTVVDANPLGREAEAERWLEEISRDERQREDAVADAIWLLNQALHALRAATADPYIPEVSATQALVVRIGYGSGTQVAEGQFSDARELPPPKGPRWRPRAEDLRPQERLAAVLGGREGIQACETLLLRARADVEGERFREAALQLRTGLEALLVELRDALSDPGHQEDIALLDGRREEVETAARAALAGDLSEEQEKRIEELLAVAERVLRRRRVLRG